MFTRKIRKNTLQKKSPIFSRRMGSSP